MPERKAIREVCAWERDAAPMMEHYREAEAQGYRVTALEERPRLPHSLEHVIAAARDLAGDRTPAGFPFLAVCAWADRVGVDPFELAEQLRAINEVQDEVPADG